MAKAVWTIDPRQVTMVVDKVTGALTLTAPLKDSGALAVTFTITVTAERAMLLFADLPEGSTLTDFQAWSNR